MRFLILLLWLAIPALACLNLFEHTLDGRKVEVDFERGGDPELILRHDLEWWRARLRLTAQTLEERNDRAVALVHLGRAKEALAIFEQLERESPGRYQTATNLGTCYELCGDDVKALAWTRQGIQRNPYSHDGTEWLHERILLAKFGLAKDPRWLEHFTILGYDFGSEPRPVWPAQLATVAQRAKVRKALERQLQERAPLARA